MESTESRLAGEIFAQRSEGVAWLELMGAWRPRIVVYVDELRALASAASSEARSPLGFWSTKRRGLRSSIASSPVMPQHRSSPSGPISTSGAAD